MGSTALLKWIFILTYFFQVVTNHVLAQEKSPQLISFATGILNPSHPRFAAQLEWRGSPFTYNFRPQLGIFTSEFNSFFFYGGVAFDLFIKRIIFTPSFSPTIYCQGHGRDLGCRLVFRSAIELGYLFPNCMRIGTQFGHYSNAHLSNRNPGVNFVLFCLSLPLGCAKSHE